MAYESIYRAEWKNFEGVMVILHISDTTTGQINPPTFHEMTALSCNKVVALDLEEKTGFKPTRINFSFLATDTIGLMTFVEGEDNRWLVEVFIGNTSNNIFTGFLVMDATQRRFMPDGTYGVEITATDCLGVLKETELSDFDGDIPRGRFRLIDYIAWCLSKTNLQLPIKAIYNLFEENYNGTSHDPFSTIYLEARTFEAGINKRESCYTVLQKILPGCVITQENGAWWILRTDEINSSSYRYYTYTYTGTYTGAATLSRVKQIGINNTFKLINRDALVQPERKKKYVRQTYNFKYPQELICNVNFSRGTTLPLSIPGGAAYTIECWTPGRQGATPLVSPYIRRLFTNGYETERVVVLPQAAIGTGFTQTQHYIESEPIEVSQGDKFIFSVDGRLTQNISGSSGTYRDEIVQIRLYANDGTRWMITNESQVPYRSGDWVQSSSTFSTNRQYVKHIWNAAQEDETQWYSVSVVSSPIPRTGFITIVLMQSPLYGSITDTHYANLQFEYIPLIAGIYKQLTGQYHRVSTPEVYRANVEEEIYLANSPNPNFKGTLWRYNGSTFLQAGRFYNFLAGTSGELGLEKYGKYEAFALWNQNNRVIRKFTGSVLGLNTTSPADLPGLLDRYDFTAPDSDVDNKYYQLAAFNQNLVNCQWSGTFMEVFDTVEGKSFDDPHEFVYIDSDDN